MANSSETDALRNDLDQLRKDFSTLSESIKERSNEQLHAGMHKARDSVKDVGGEIEARPFTSVITAFGVGLLLGSLFRR